jgi:electron transfer flavoprotein beta subunit
VNCIVCVKEIPDPEIPPVKFKLDTESLRVLPPEGIPPVINPYDELAVELALKLKEKYGGKITVLSVGEKSATRIVKHALALGADEGILLQDEAFSEADSFTTAYILSRAIQKIGEFDLILCGRQAADWDEGLVGTLIAEKLDLPLVTQAQEIAIVNGEFKIKRTILYGYQIFAVPKPAVVTVSSEVGQPRLPSGWGIISASRTQIPVWNAENINADINHLGVQVKRRKLTNLFIPKHERKCKIITGKTSPEAAVQLAESMRKAGVI